MSDHLDSDAWNKAYVSHIREIIELIKSMEDKSIKDIINKLESIAKAIEGSYE